jgi:transcriptional regulator with XRE-family HTH domain
MDDRRVGLVVRAARQRRELRQADLAKKANVSQGFISNIEGGRLASVSLNTLRRVASEIDVIVTLTAQWRGGQGDRLIDRAHASLVDFVIATLREARWEVLPEFTFNHYGDRGSVDVLAWHPGERILLIIEVKATLKDLQDLLASLSKTLRVVPAAARTELGWNANHVARIVVVAATHLNRAVVTKHGATFNSSFPARSRRVKAWLVRPSGPIAGVWFVPSSAVPTGTPLVRARVRRGNGRGAF